VNYDDLTVGELLKLSGDSLRTAVHLSFVILRRCRYQIFWAGLTLTAAAISLASLGGFVLLQATPVRFLKRIAWATELSSNFRLYYLVILAALTLLFLLGRKVKRGLVVAIFAGLNLALLIPFYVAPPAAPAASQTFRTLMINTGFLGTSGASVIDLVRTSEPDFVVLLEAKPKTHAALQTLHDIYPFTTYQLGTDYYDGTSLYSKYPFTVEEGVQEGRKYTPSLVTQVDLGGHDLILISTQTRAPMRPGRTVDRREQFQQLAKVVAAQPEPVLLLGDLNATAWSPIFRDFLRTSGLQDGRHGFGLQASWPTFLPLLAIPIDHALISTGVTVHSFTKGPDVGSDHYPILVDFSLDTRQTVNN
jgi:endonuclease/exonuclease/phosphatase (EEP) superfamily protein YafD